MNRRRSSPPDFDKGRVLLNWLRPALKHRAEITEPLRGYKGVGFSRLRRFSPVALAQGILLRPLSGKRRESRRAVRFLVLFLLLVLPHFAARAQAATLTYGQTVNGRITNES